MRNSVVLAVIVLFVIFIGCDKDLMNRKKTTYDIVNIKGLLDTLALSTFKSNPLIIKYSSVNGQEDTARVHLDSTAWQKELQLFGDLNIRSSRLVGRYKKEDKALEDDQVLTIWRAKDYKNEDLDSLMLWENDKKISKIEFFINQKNHLFKSEKYYSLSFLPNTEHPRLQAYHITGNQKMRLNDSSSFEVDAHLKY